MRSSFGLASYLDYVLDFLVEVLDEVCYCWVGEFLEVGFGRESGR